jgi:adenine C2-methylase RlmN of 23S rRNA A2503 and tRNA A37
MASLLEACRPHNLSIVSLACFESPTRREEEQSSLGRNKTCSANIAKVQFKQKFKQNSNRIQTKFKQNPNRIQTKNVEKAHKSKSVERKKVAACIRSTFNCRFSCAICWPTKRRLLRNLAPKTVFRSRSV